MTAEHRQVIAITGASSGLARSTALAFAGQRACLALAARDAAALAAVADECRSIGGEALIRPIDVSNAAAVDDFRKRAVDAFGRIDVWVNCAAALLLGRFEQLPPEAFRRVLETNILGYANGARAALNQFHAQGDRGVLINVSSILGVVGEPYASAYVTSKFAIVGLTACLRQEMRDFPDIHVCTVLPAALDTPIYQHAGNHMGQGARSIVPVYDPSKAAKAILRLVARPRSQVIVGGFGRLIVAASRIVPTLLERAVGRLAPKLQFEPQATTVSPGNLFESAGANAERGGWREYWRKRLSPGRED